MPDALHFTGNEEADRLIAEEPLALLDRLRARSAGDGADRVRRPAQVEAAARPPRRRRDRRPRSGPPAGGLPREARHPPLPGKHGQARPGDVRPRGRGVRRRCKPCLARRHRHRRPEAADRGAPGLRRDEGEGARLGARPPVTATRWRSRSSRVTRCSATSTRPRRSPSIRRRSAPSRPPCAPPQA